MPLNQRTLVAAIGAMATLFVTAACVDINGAGGIGRYVEREDKRFEVSGRPDVALATFDGSIEVRSWERPEVLVVVEKRGYSKASAASIEIHTEQKGAHIVVEATMPKNTVFGSWWHRPLGAKLIVSLPASSDVTAQTGDGSIDIEHINGKLALHSGDGRVRGRDLGGELTVRTGDGSVAADGAFTNVHAQTGDGRVTIRAAPGSVPSADWDIETGDGSVTIELPANFNGELDAQTGDGRVRLQDISVSNVSGEIQRGSARGRIGSGGRTLRVRTGDGSITLRAAGPVR
jgi:hypothetical protein